MEISGFSNIKKIESKLEFHYYSAIRDTDHKEVVLRFPNETNISSQTIGRMKDEWELSHVLESSQLIKVLDFIQSMEKPFLVLEYFKGIAINKPYFLRSQTLRQKLEIAIKLAGILMEINESGIIHQDIRLENFLIHPETGEIKLATLSSAGYFDNPVHSSEEFEPHCLEFTHTSPEQTRRISLPIDYRTDLYSLGISLYELFTGHLPFRSSDWKELVYSHLAVMPPAPAEKNNEVPKAVSDIIMKLIRKSPDSRYQSAYGLKCDLEKCAELLDSSNSNFEFVIGLQDVSMNLIIPDKLYGRERETSLIESMFFDTTRGAHQLLLVKGVSGIGKTALIKKIQLPVLKSNGLFVEGKFERNKSSLPYGAIRQAVGTLLLNLLKESERTLDSYRQELLDAFKGNGQVIAGIIPEIKLITGELGDLPEVQPQESQNRFNLVFKDFLRVFSTREHPLVFFLDDLQWADDASLQLLLQLISDEELHYLLLIGSYRNNEIETGSPFALFVDQYKTVSSRTREIELPALTRDDLSLLLAESLNIEKLQAAELAAMMESRTSGNPFFIREFLFTMRRNKLLFFKNHRWQYALGAIASMNLDEHVADLMLNRIRQLPLAELKYLKIAACLGTRCDLSQLSLITNADRNQILKTLAEAFTAGILIKEEDSICFAHDKLQESTYSLLSKDEQEQMHLSVGILLLAEMQGKDSPDAQFQVAAHLNLVHHLLNDSEKRKLLNINIAAGIRAKSVAAFATSAQLFERGNNLLKKDSWNSDYDQTILLTNEWAEAEYLSGNIVKAEVLFASILRNSRSVIEKVKAYEIKISYKSTSNDYITSMQLCREALKLLGLNLPEKVNTALILLELLKLKISLKRKKVGDLIGMPPMTDEKQKAVVRILMQATVPTYIAFPDYFPLIVFKLVRLSFAFGNSLYSSYAYSVYGMISVNALGNIEEGFQFSQLAIKMIDQQDQKLLRSKVYFVHGAFVNHFKLNISTNLPFLIAGAHSGYQHGDLEFAGYNILHYINNYFFSGRPLPEVENECRYHYNTIRKYRQPNSTQAFELIYQLVSNLSKTPTKAAALDGEIFNKEKILPLWEAANNHSNLGSFYIGTGILKFLQNDPTSAIAAFRAATGHLSGVMGMMFVPAYYFYYSLALIADYDHLSLSGKIQCRLLLRKNIRKMKKWAAHAPSNFENKYYIMQAELAGLEGKFRKSFKLFTTAIAHSGKHKFILEEALANEGLAKLLSRFKLEGQSYHAHLNQARLLFDQYGLGSKSFSSGSEFPTAGRDNPEFNPVSFSASSASDMLDIHSIIQASQTISREIDTDRLLESILRIAYLNSGANYGALILQKGGKLIPKAINSASENTILLEDDQEDASTLYPEKIIQYVYNSGKTVILDNAEYPGNFTNEPFLKQNRSRSVLCLPIFRNYNKLGVLYLENNLTTNAFTSRHIETLNILLVQAAISIENAQFFENIKSERDFSSGIIQNSPVLICGINPLGITSFVNPATEIITGYSHEELIGKNWWEKIFPGKYYDQVKEFIGRPQPALSSFELKLQARDGQEKIILWNVFRRLNSDDTLQDTICFGNEITEIRNMQEKLFISEQLFRTTYFNAPIGIVIASVSGEITRCNDYFCKILGYQESELIGKHFKEISHPGDLKEDLGKMHRLLLKEVNSFGLRKRYLRKNKSEVWTNLTVALIQDREGKPDYLIATVEDITEQLVMEHKLQNAYNDLQQSNDSLQEANSLLEEQQAKLIYEKMEAQKSDQLKTAFLQNMSHEIRTPLNGLVGFSSLMIDPRIEADEKSNFEKLIRTCSDQLLHIVNDILDVSQIETGTIRIYDEPIELISFLKEIASLHSAEGSKKGVLLSFENKSELRELYFISDRKRLLQIMNNLLNNALKFTHQGSVHFGFNTDGKMLEFYVRDTGVGIPESKHRIIFERFRQGEIRMDPQYGGAGLGLTISENLVRLLGGKIWLESEPGKGSCFYFDIPLKQPATPAKVIALPAPEKEINDYVASGDLILIVEDEDTNFQLLQRILGLYKLNSIRARDGDEAVSLCQDKPELCLVLMDLKLPGMNGFEATRMIKSFRPSLPVIAQSAFAMISDREKALREGCDEYIPKPINPGNLLPLLKKFLPHINLPDFN